MPALAPVPLGISGWFQKYKGTLNDRRSFEIQLDLLKASIEADDHIIAQYADTPDAVKHIVRENENAKKLRTEIENHMKEKWS